MKKLLFALPIILLLAAGCNSAQPANNQPSGWQTYTNADLGISFNYPQNYKVYQLDEKRLRVISDYKNSQFPVRNNLSMVIEKLTTTPETTAQVEARFKPNFFVGMPQDLKDKLSKQTYSSKSKDNYTLYRVQDDVIGLYYFVQSNKGTFTASSGDLEVFKQALIQEGVYQKYSDIFEQIVNTIKIK